jgi:hypothetical protein
MRMRASRLDNGIAAKRDRLLNLNDTLFSLNLGLAVAIGLRVYLSQFSAGRNNLVDFFARPVYGINSLFGRVHDHAGADVIFLILVTGFTIAIFLLLRLIASGAITRPVLSMVEGLVVVGALPACWLYVESAVDPSSSSAWPIWFLLAGIPLICVYLYWRDMWPVPDCATAALLTLFCGFWGWMLSQHIGSDPFRFVFPIVSLCSGISWGLLVSRARPRLDDSNAERRPTG